MTAKLLSLLGAALAIWGSFLPWEGWGDVAYPGSSPYLTLFLAAMRTGIKLQGKGWLLDM